MKDTVTVKIITLTQRLIVLEVPCDAETMIDANKSKLAKLNQTLIDEIENLGGSEDIVELNGSTWVYLTPREYAQFD